MITTTTTRKEYIKNLKSFLDDLNSKMNTWETGLHDAKASAGESSTELLKALRDKREKAKHKLAEVQDVGEQAWEDVAEGAVQAFDDLEAAFTRATARFGS